MADDLNINWGSVPLPVTLTAPAAPAQESPKVAEKKAAVQEAATQKMAIYGTPEQQRVVATADINGNRMGQSEAVQDIHNLNPIQFADKYGIQAEKDRVNYIDAFRGTQALERAERTNGQMTGDAAIDIGTMAGTTVGNLIGLGAAAVDQELGTTFGPAVTQATDDFTSWARGNQSQLMQDRREQLAIAAELDKQDRQALYEERLDANAGADNAWERSVKPWLQKQGAAVLDTAGNYANDPIMAGSLVTEGVGSMIPQTLGAKILGKAGALSKLSSQGITGDAAKAYLKTAAGRELIAAEQVSRAASMIAATEGGAAVSQAQQDILGLSEEDLADSPEYQELRKTMSHEDAKTRLAADAGLPAAAMALPGAMLGGKLAAPLVAAPLSVAPKGMITSALGHIAEETGEEFLQEANTQLVSNAMVRSLGVDRALDEGVAEAGTAGALGGLGTAGAMQAPALAARGIIEAGKAGVAGAKAGGAAVAPMAGKALSAAEARNAAKVDAKSPVGTAAQAEASTALQDAGSQVVAALENHTTPQQTVTEGEAVADPVRESQDIISKGLFPSEEELKDATDDLPGIAAFREANPDQPIQRGQILDEAGKAFMAPDADVFTKTGMAVMMLRHLDSMRSMDGTKVEDTIGALPEDDQTRASYEALKTNLALKESSPVVDAARKHMRSLTAEQVEEIIPPDLLTSEDFTPEQKKAGVEALETIAAVNPEAVRPEVYDLVLDQLVPLGISDVVRKRLLAARKVVANFLRSDSAKAQIQADKEASLKAQAKAAVQVAPKPQAKGPVAPLKAIGAPKEKAALPPKSAAVVRKEILYTGNSDNKMLSLEEHRQRISNAGRAGRDREAMEALEDLRNFAVSQANKVAALNQSAEGAQGKKVPFLAHGPYSFFMKDEQKGVYVNLRSANSVALARDVHVDAETAAILAQDMAEGFGYPIEPVQIPALHASITQAATQAPAQDVAPAKATDVTPTAPAQPDAAAVTQAAKAPEAKAEEKPKDPAPKPEVTKDEAVKDPAAVPAQPAEAGAQSRDERAPEAVETQAAQEEAPQSQPEADPAIEDAGEELEVTAEAEISESAPSAGWFAVLKDTLLRSKEGLNLFLDSFRAKKEGSTLTSHERPVAWLGENIEGMEGLNQIQKTALQAVVKDDIPAMARLINQHFLNHLEKTQKAKTNGKWDWDKITDRMLMVKNTPLAFLTRGENDVPMVEPRVLAATAMAVYEWMLANGGPRRKMDKEAINKMFGRAKTELVPTDLIEASFHGPAQQASLEQISNKIMRLLDISPKKDVDIRRTQGLIRALASNAIEAMMVAESPWIEKRVTQPFKVGDQTRQSATLRIADAIATDDDFKVLAQLRDPFSRIFTPKGEKPRYIGEAPKLVDDRQMNNRFAMLSKSERKVLQRLQNIPAYLNMPMVDLVEAMGGEAFNRLLGYRGLSETEQAQVNPDHFQSIKGKDQSLLHELAGTFGYVEEVRQLAGDQDPALVPIFHKWELSSVGRLQQVGPITPQGSKTAREMIAATNATIDLNNEAHQQALWLAVAQSLGVKIEKNQFQKSLDQAQELVSDPAKLGGAVELLQHWLRGDLDDAFPVDEFEQALKGSGIGITPKVLHALLTVARANEAMGTEGATSFKTALAVEADGKTDGPINAMVHMGVGEFQAEDIARFAKGGLFFTDQALSLNDFINAKDAAGNPIAENGKDLYNLAADRFKTVLKEWGESAEKEVSIETLQVLDAFLDGFRLGQPKEDGSYDPNEMEIERSVPKNPLTVFLYGSSVGGIANKIADAVADELAKTLTELMELGRKGGKLSDHKLFQEHPGILEAMDMVLFMGHSGAAKAWMVRPHKAVMTDKMRQELAAHIERSFAEPMIEAIDEATGGLQANMRATQQAASVQTVIFQEIFQAKVDERQQELVDAQAQELTELDKSAPRADGKPHKKAKPLLTEQELQDIFAETMKIAPVYGTDIQQFHIAAPKKAVQDGATVSESFGGSVTTDATYIEPSDASVKVSPYLTIGTGDGRMILNIYLRGDGSLETSLPVFDGVEQAVDQVDTASAQINESVYRGWMDGNPYQAISSGFEQMMNHLTEDEFSALMKSPAFAKDLAWAMNLPKGQAPTYAGLKWIAHDMATLAMQNAARKAAMKKMAVSVDHMAGAEAPHSTAGEVVAEGDANAFEAIAEKLNEFYREELQALTAAAEAEVTPAYELKPNANMAAAISKIGEAVPGHEGVTRLTAAQARALLSRANGASNEQLYLMRDLEKQKAIPEDALFFFGSSAALEAFRDQEFADLPKRPIQAGQTFSRAKVTFITNAAPETLLHEVLHGYTASVLQDYYADPAAAPEHVQVAVKGLEALAQDVLDLAVDESTDAVLEDKDATALEVIQGILSNQALPKAVRVSELISYMLSNQDLIEKGRKTKNYRMLASLFQKGLRLIKQLLGINRVPEQTLYGAIRTQTELLVAEAKDPGLEAAKADQVTNQVLEQTYGGSERISRIESQYFGQIRAQLSEVRKGPFKDLAKGQVAKLRQRSNGAISRASQAGFGLTGREAKAFEAIHVAMGLNLKSDQPVTRHLYEAFSHVAKTLQPEHFIKAWGLEGQETADDRQRAEKMRDHIIGANGLRAGANGRSDLLASFLALAQTSPDMQAALAQMQPPKVAELQWSSVDDWLTSIGTSGVNILTRASLNPRMMAPNMQKEMALLSDTLTEIQGDRSYMAAVAQLGSMTDKANAYVADKIDEFGTKVTDRIELAAQQASNKRVGQALNVAGWITSILSRERSSEKGEALTTMLNHAPGLSHLRSLLNDLRGATDSNRPLMRLINPVKASIDALRQDFREKVPEELAKAFTRRLSKEEWARLHQGIARGDLLALGRNKAEEILKDPSTLAQHILDAEERIHQEGGAFADRYKAKARSLARYMVRGEVTSQNLLRNAHAIAHLYGERGSKAKTIDAQATDSLIDAIDELTSLYAYELQDPALHQTLAGLMSDEAEGMTTVTGFLNSVRQMELERRDRYGVNAVAQNNGWKGYVPTLVQEGATIVVADDSDYDAMVRRGYERVGDYKGDRNESYRQARGYYRSSVGGKSAFRQGVAQTVHETWQGVDARTGRTTGGTTAGLMLGSRVSQLAEAFDQSPAGSLDDVVTGEHLMPVLDAGGQIVAYERPMSAEMKDALPRDRHLGRMLGIWAGRILEENVSDEFNQELAKTLAGIRAKDMVDGRKSEYVNIADPEMKDAVIKDAWETLGWRMKEELKEAFGDEGAVWLRRDMVDDAIGYRAASVTDFWTGTSRWDPKQQENIRRTAEALLGPNAFKWLKQGEGVVSDAVSYAKTTIIVRSVVVAWDNITANFLHLSLSGVPLPMVLKGTRDKFSEITEYVKNRDEIQALQVKVAAVIQDPAKSRPLEARIQALEEANARMSIAPLIKEGEFSTISENLTEADVAIREGKFSDFMEKAADSLPEWAQGTGKNLLITKDSAVFRGLNRFVQYGDFVAKAVLYDHLTKTKKMSEREALDVIFEEFVAYNKLPGRGRDFLESMGLMWFWNYTLRIQKIAAKTLRERPVSSLMMMGVTPHLGIDTVWDGSLVGKVLDGGIGYKIGPEMLIDAPFTHPLLAVTT